MSDTDEKDPASPAGEAPDPAAQEQQEQDWKAEAEKWKALARKHEGQAKANADAARKLAETEDANKSDIQRATDKAAEAETRAATAEANALRIEVALDKAPDGMPLAQVRKLAKRLTGGTREELEADADELFGDFAPAQSDRDTQRRPRERLRPGAAPDTEPDETDPRKLAASVPRMY